MTEDFTPVPMEEGNVVVPISTEEAAELARIGLDGITRTAGTEEKPTPIVQRGVSGNVWLEFDARYLIDVILAWARGNSGE
jgi:hypothetical protein